MPLFTVTMKTGRGADEKNAISRAIHEASVKAGYPEDDKFQRFLCLEQADLKVDLNYLTCEGGLHEAKDPHCARLLDDHFLSGTFRPGHGQCSLD
jgi:hypothetical protein